MKWRTALHLALGVSLGVSLGILLWTSIDAGQVWSILTRAAVSPLILAVLALGVDFVLRAIRFWAMLQAATAQSIPVRRCIWPFIASFGISDLLPLRAGDGYRIMWFNRRLGLPLAKIVGAMAVERILDLLAVILLGVIAVTLTSAAIPPILQQGVQLALAMLALAVVAIVAAPAVFPAPDPHSGRRLLRWAAYVLNGCRSTSEAFIGMARWGRASLFIVLTLLCWSFEYLVFHAAWISLGGDAGTVAQPLFAFSFSTLGTLAPGLPGHFGSFEFFGVKAFDLIGTDRAFGTAVLLLAHLCLWFPTALCGVIWLMAEGFRSSRSPARH